MTSGLFVSKVSQLILSPIVGKSDEVMCFLISLQFQRGKAAYLYMPKRIPKSESPILHAEYY